MVRIFLLDLDFALEWDSDWFETVIGKFAFELGIVVTVRSNLWEAMEAVALDRQATAVWHLQKSEIR